MLQQSQLEADISLPDQLHPAQLAGILVQASLPDPPIGLKQEQVTGQQGQRAHLQHGRFREQPNPIA
jgi:hypothetical protein